MTPEEANARHEAKEVTRQQCVEFLECFARDYVNKWQAIEGEGAKAQGWAILQAAAALRDSSF